MNGLEPDVEKGGAIHSISTYPKIAEVNGNNYITIRYADSDLKKNSESNLRIFKWSDDEKNGIWLVAR